MISYNGEYRMSRIIEIFESKKTLLAGNGATEDQVSNAENLLGLHFASEYREYLLRYGVAVYDGHELTGITSASRTNVVDVTLNERIKIKTEKLYVIEDTNYDGIIIWQASEGSIYASAPNMSPTKIYDSLSDYVLQK